jgi:hypothetical protein
VVVEDGAERLMWITLAYLHATAGELMRLAQER